MSSHSNVMRGCWWIGWIHTLGLVAAGAQEGHSRAQEDAIPAAADYQGAALGDATEEDTHVQLSVYNIAGQLVSTLVDGHKPRGMYTTTWDGTDVSGVGVSSGVHWVLLQADQFRDTRKIMLVR